MLWEAVQLALAALDKPAAGRSGEQSYAVPAFEGEVELGQWAFAPALRYRALDLVLQELVAQYWPPQVKAPELPEEQQARLRAA